MIEFLLEFAKSRNIDAQIDDVGNVYMSKGQVSKGDFYPCVVAHTDTVHEAQIHWVKYNRSLEVLVNEVDGNHILSCDCVGIGADDKAGILICLTIIENLPVVKATFCRGRDWLLWQWKIGFVVV